MRWGTWAVFALALGACGSTYDASGPLRTYNGEVGRQLDCLDIRVERRPGARVTLRYHIGNRCLGPQRVDLAAVRVHGAFGTELVDLPVRDPRGELRPGTLDGRSELFEEISYETPDPGPSSICVTLDGVVDGADGAPLCMQETT